MAKVLLVEDDNNLREIYEARLTAEGYDIIAAQNGEDALVLAKQHHPDLVISDVMMPRISGYEMLDILRNTEELKHTKVIMLTALGQNEDKERAGKLGADKYLVKSQVTLEDIVNSAKALLADDSVGTPQAAATPDPTDPLGMSTTPATDVTLPSVSPVAATVTPLASATEPATEPAVVETPVVVAPDPQPASQSTPPTAPAVEPTEPATEPELSATQPSAVQGPDTVVETEPLVVAPQAATTPTDSPEPAVEASTAQAPNPVSVDALINGDPAAVETVAEVVQAEAGEAQSTENEQALVDEKIAAFNQDEPAPTYEAPTPQPEASQENDAVLNDAAHTLATDSAVNSAADPVVPEPSNETSESGEPSTTAVEPHDIQGLSGVTEVVEVPSEPHVDPQPSTTATVIQPEVQHAEPQEATLTEPTAPETTPMTQTFAPTETPQAPVEQPDTVPENDGVNVVGKKVIQPLTDPNAKPDLDKLLAQEEAKQTGEVLPQPSAGAPAAATPKPQTGFDPNNIAL